MKLCCADTTVYNWMLHADVSQDIILKGLFILHDAHATVSFMSSTTAHMSRWMGEGGSHLCSLWLVFSKQGLIINQAHVVPFFVLPHMICLKGLSRLCLLVCTCTHPRAMAWPLFRDYIECTDPCSMKHTFLQSF